MGMHPYPPPMQPHAPPPPRPPPSGGGGLAAGVIIGALAVVAIVGIAAAGYFYTRLRAADAPPTTDASMVASASGAVPPDAGPGPIASTPASAASAISSAAAKGAGPKASAGPAASGGAKEAKGNCLCLSPKAPDRQALCKALVPRKCYCSESGVRLCPAPFLPCMPGAACDGNDQCPDKAYATYHPIPGAKSGGACAGFTFSQNTTTHVITSTPARGVYSCQSCGDTRTYAGPHGAPCKGFHPSDEQPYDGVTDCY